MTRARAFVCAGLLALAGCSSRFVKIAAVPPPEATLAARVRGTGCGFLLLSLIPIGVNGRTQRAYDAAVHQAGAQGLTDTDVTTSWYYAFIGTVQCTAVEGTPIP